MLLLYVGYSVFIYLVDGALRFSNYCQDHTVLQRARMTPSSVNSLGQSICSVMLKHQVQVSEPLVNETLNDILFGDVWICSGQSDMAFSVQNMYNASAVC